jgi:hypothetical protein
MRRPSRLSWLIVGGVAALLVVAVADALRSAKNESARRGATAPTETETSPSTTASTTETEASLSAWQEIEQVGNDWARLFSAGDRDEALSDTCKHMTQPGCERLACQRVGYGLIENCTRPSWAFQKSFADATVKAIAIKGHRAAAIFSNGEVVRFWGDRGGWWIHKVGGNAGRNFFE